MVLSQDITGKSIEELDQQLNLTAAEQAAYQQLHLPYGLPQLDRDDMDVCVLTQEGHVTGYSRKYRMPLWTGFQLEGQVESGLDFGFKEPQSICDLGGHCSV
jgi:hypothetical protein